MHSLEGTIAVNNAAVLREYQEAIDSKNTELALRILRANPDVFSPAEVDLATIMYEHQPRKRGK